MYKKGKIFHIPKLPDGLKMCERIYLVTSSSGRVLYEVNYHARFNNALKTFMIFKTEKKVDLNNSVGCSDFEFNGKTFF